MTTIATDGVTIAADSLSTMGHELSRHPATKIKVRDGRVYAYSGLTGMFDAIIEWHRTGANPKEVPPKNPQDTWTLLVCDGKTVQLYHSEAPYPVQLRPPIAIGGGAEFATGAMDAGATPAQAVELAIARVTHSGPPVQVVNIREALGLDLPAIVRDAAE